MTRYTITPSIKSLVNSSEVTSEDKKKILSNGWISHRDLITLYKLSLAGQPETDLLKLLKGTKIYRDPPVKPKKSPEFIKMMEQLRLKEQELEYQKMVNDDLKDSNLRMMIEIQEDERRGRDHKASQVAKEVKSQLTTVVNILVTVFSVVYAIWYWTGSSTNMAIHYRVLWCLFFGILVLIAEVVVFGGYVGKVEKARAKERAKWSGNPSGAMVHQAGKVTLGRGAVRDSKGQGKGIHEE
ncbi:DEKNAAC102505 [Brettanomyces naardenensis]|uniref:DEKNAAC102505 n=1 Tax=Brettanomyces naardenensis TaxID=13370 RepID=A0A448YLE7_BRENA|nr:DEKNAAC102505 [Brettanomyces naardenensis]